MIAGRQAPMRKQFRLIHVMALILLIALVLRFPSVAALLALAVIATAPPILYVRWIDAWRRRRAVLRSPYCFSALAVIGYFAVVGIGAMLAIVSRGRWYYSLNGLPD